MAFFPTKANSITISATARPYNQFDIDFKCDLADTTNYTSQGWQSNEAGIFSFGLNFSGPYDGSEGILPGDSTAITFATGGGGPSFVLTARLESIKISSPNIRNEVNQIAVSGQSNGAHTIAI